MPTPTIRPYEADDRAAVREICHLTGYMGEPADWYWADRESFADMWSGYYTDEEPASASVVVLDGRVSGYLVGCVDTRKAWDPVKVAGRHIVRRGLVFRPGTAPVIWRVFADVALRDRRVENSMPDLDRWPAHLHIDLLPEARGQGAGSRLLRGWLDHLGELGVAGCHLGTLAENHRAIAAFSAAGFERWREPQLVPGMRARSGERLHTQWMVREI